MFGFSWNSFSDRIVLEVVNVMVLVVVSYSVGFSCKVLLVIMSMIIVYVMMGICMFFLIYGIIECRNSVLLIVMII